MSTVDLTYNAPRVVSQFMQSKAAFKAIMGPFGCTSADTEFLTPHGWKRMDSYRDGDMVAQWRHDETIEFVKPEAYVVLDCDELIWFHNSRTSMQLSDEHRMPLYDWSKNLVVKLAADVARRPSRHIIPTTIAPTWADYPISDELLRLCVAINADGNHPKHGNQTVICVRKQRKKERIAELLRAAGIGFSERQARTRETETSFVFYSPYRGKTYSERMWWGLSRRQLQVVLDEVTHWDGLYEGADTRFFSKHIGDVEFIQYAVHAVGGCASISKTTYPDKPNWSDTYTVHIAPPGSSKAVHTLRGDAIKIERIPTVDGKKYCFTVPTGFFVARHDGSIFVTGNSGKSVGCCMDILNKCAQQIVSDDGFRRSRWAVVRNVRQQLMDTTLKTWMDWIKPGMLGYWKESDSTFYLQFNDVKAEILFRALDTPADVQKLMSLELTGAWLNESQYIPREIVEGLQGRLERYPSQKMGGSNYWSIIADTNPPAIDTYWYKIFEHLEVDDGDPNSVVICDTYKQPSGLSPDADNIKNLSKGYYEKLAKGKSKTYIDTVVHALYPPSQSGNPVYATVFRQDRHVSKVPLNIDPFLPVIMGFDTGLTPAMTFKQMGLDGRVRVLREAAAFDMGMKRFIQNYVRPIVKNFFPGNPLIFIGDPAGVRRGDGDESSAFKELKTAFEQDGAIVKAAATNDPIVRIQATEQMLSQYPDGDPLYIIDPSCKRLIEGLRSKYRYAKLKQSGEFADKPEKNEWGHLVEGDQYSNLFLLSGRYSAADYMRVTNDAFGFNSRPAYRPAQKEGY